MSSALKTALGPTTTAEATGNAAGDAADTWNFYAVVDGSARTADAAVADLHDALEPHCLTTGRYQAGSEPAAADSLPPFLRPLAGPLLGTPDGLTLRSIYDLTRTPPPADPHAMDADHTPFGMKCCIPIIPTKGHDARRVATIAAAARRRHGTPNIKPSFFGDGRTLITIHFDTRDPDQVRRATDAEATLWDDLAAAGYPPYRLGIDQMRRAVARRSDFFRLVYQLKQLLDPNGIIAPGRYCPTDLPPPGRPARSKAGHAHRRAQRSIRDTLHVPPRVQPGKGDS